MEAMKLDADELGYPTSLWNLTECIMNSDVVKDLHGGLNLGLVNEETSENEYSDQEESRDVSASSQELIEEFQLALGRLQNEVGSLDRNLISWDHVKSKLAIIFEFPGDNVENKAVGMDNGGVKNKKHESGGNTYGDATWDKRDRIHLQAPSPGSAKKRTVRSRKSNKIAGNMGFTTYRNLLFARSAESKYNRSMRDSAVSGANSLRRMIQFFPKKLSNLFGDRESEIPKEDGSVDADANRKYDEVEVEDLEEKSYQNLLRKEEREEENESIKDCLDKLHRQMTENEERRIRQKELAEKERILKEIEERERQEELEKQAREAEAKKAAQNLLREMTPDEHQIVENAMYGRGPADEKLAATDTDSVQRSSMQTLQPGAWLNDEVIHFFFNMLAKRDESLCASDASGRRKRCHYFKSFFFTKLFDEGASNQYRYANVKRWSKRVPGKDIFALDKIFFACNVNQMHWTCAVIFMQQKRIQFYDSMRGDGYHYSQGLFKYLLDEWKAKKGGELPDKDQWKIVGNEQSVPTQQNGYDCGVFTCMFADFLSLDRPLSFTQEHITQCRERIALSIMKGVAIE